MRKAGKAITVLGPLRRTAPRPRISRPLHSPCGHFQPAPAGIGKRGGLLRVERLPRCRQRQSDDRLRRGFHSPLPPTHSSAGFPAHPLLRLSGQLPSGPQARSLPPTAGHAVLRPTAEPQRLPRLPAGTYQHRVPALPAVWRRHPGMHSVATPATYGQLMKIPGPNPQLHQLCSCQGILFVCPEPAEDRFGNSPSCRLLRKTPGSRSSHPSSNPAAAPPYHPSHPDQFSALASFCRKTIEN